MYVCLYVSIYLQGLARWLSGKESACQCRRWKRCRFDPWLGRIPWSRKWQPTPVFLPENFPGQRSLVGEGSRGHKELDMTNTHSLEKAMVPTPVLLPGKSHGWRSLVGCSPWGFGRVRHDFAFTFHFHALEKEMATHSSVLAWRIPGTGEPGGLPSMG